MWTTCSSTCLREPPTCSLPCFSRCPWTASSPCRPRRSWWPCGKEHHIFGEPQGAAVAEKYGIPAVATLPMDPSFARLVDEGRVEAYNVEGALNGIIDEVEKVAAVAETAAE